MKLTTGKQSVRNMAWSMVLGGAVALLCVPQLASAQANGAPPADQPAGAPGGAPGGPGGAPGGAGGPGGGGAPANSKDFKAAKLVDGNYDVTLVLPRMTVHNVMTLCSDGQVLKGSLHDSSGGTLMGNFAGHVNDSGFLFDTMAGPGHPYFVGFADGETVSGHVTIDKMTSEFKGTLSAKKYDCSAK